MKNKASLFPYFTVILLLASAFTNKSVPAAIQVKPSEAAVEAPVGGAYLMFAGKFGGEVTRSEIAATSEVRVDGCAKGSRIFQFTLSVSKNGRTTVLAGQANILSGEIMTQLKSLSKGDSFEFRNTKAYLPNGSDVVEVHAKKFIVV